MVKNIRSKLYLEFQIVRVKDEINIQVSSPKSTEIYPNEFKNKLKSLLSDIGDKWCV